MSHHHHHDDHHHYHHHAEHENEKAPESLSQRDKLTKIVSHWIQHNEDHARSYREWAHRAHEMGLGDVHHLLEDVAEQTDLQNRNLEKVLSALGEKTS
ncbi:hypothetical protein [Desulforhabdus amnigena]|jgi:hypothetical protein|uniref:DUF8180 domain-containing protein n=1 Tax=Desulforhabdus amnigena TaxID=40218 RepID=A0A9W6FW08_9BACT|nr:hypothetical protein [Desulforhabdus amnigena]NLJ26972.1 hypothetical protein [Deltaproteobacteria bacterium]GLI35852.1 hypothetical protein DAMNIGENAA_32850 [Desulforhabdus amnigena]